MPPHVDLLTLVRLFADDPAQLGQFTPVEAVDLPDDYRRLLAHEHHMTVTVEAFHRAPVDVEVLAVKAEGDLYAREILLRRRDTKAVVQFGIVRIDLRQVSDDVRREIVSQRTPLGRILIEHGVLRSIQLVSLLRVDPGPELARHFAPARGVTYGRTALILCDDAPAVELLEIVAPLGD